ncbi:MAG: hypothetical protein U0Z53_01450 [Blastocatellia bacterium]
MSDNRLVYGNGFQSTTTRRPQTMAESGTSDQKRNTVSSQLWLPSESVARSGSIFETGKNKIGWRNTIGSPYENKNVNAIALPKQAEHLLHRSAPHRSSAFDGHRGAPGERVVGLFPVRVSMITRLFYGITFLVLFPLAGTAAPKIVQSLTVDFPVNGRVFVQARESIGKYPEMLFVSANSGQVLLQKSIQDKDKWLIPSSNDSAPPNLRFRVIRSKGFASPLIMSVGAYYGGSDNAYFLTVFGEVDGKIKCLNQQPIFANIQGGYYLGFLNSQVGYGLACWNFIWGKDIDESHYSKHRYEIEIYQFHDGKFQRTIRSVTKRKYQGNGAESLREVRIKAYDQRKGVPKIKDSLDCC